MGETEPVEEMDGEIPVEDDAFQSILEDHLDLKDYQIYRVLNRNGRMSDTELGETVGLSRTAARRRRRKLQEEGIIDILAVLILQEADLSYADVRVQLAKDVESESIDSFIETLLGEELVYEIDEYLGEYDLLLRIRHRTLHELKSYVADLLQGVEEIDDYQIAPVIRTRKAWNKVITDGSRSAVEDREREA